MITKRTSSIRLMVCLVAFVFFFLYMLVEGDNFIDVLGWLVLSWLLMFGEWTLFVWLRERIGRFCYPAIPCFCILYYYIGMLIVDAIPGWSGLGAALMFLFSLVVLAGAVVFFLIEMLIYLLYRKRNK